MIQHLKLFTTSDWPSDGCDSALMSLVMTYAMMMSVSIIINFYIISVHSSRQGQPPQHPLSTIRFYNLSLI